MHKPAKPSSSSIKFLPPIPSDNKPLTDLSIYNVGQLSEIRDRQLHLLSNKKRLATLPDRGDRIRKLHERVIAELATRDAVQQASELFSALNIAATGKSMTTQMEWLGKSNIDTLDAAAADPVETDERDPLKLLAQSRQTAKVVTVEPPAETLITAADRQQIAEFAQEKPGETTEGAITNGDAATAVAELEPHAVYMCSIDDRHPDKKERFLPHKTTVAHGAAAGSLSPQPATSNKSPNKSQSRHWENTAATFPVLRNQAVVALSLQDSIEIQRQRYAALKSVELVNAAERLRAHEQLVAKLQLERDQVDDGSVTRTLFGGAYRSAPAHSDSDTNSSDDDADAINNGCRNGAHSDDEDQEEN